MLGSFGLAAARSSAQSSGDLNTRIAAAQSEAEALGARLEARSGELAAASTRARSAAQREAALSATLASGQERAAELRGEVEAATGRLGEAKLRLRRARSTLADRLVAIYKSGEVDASALLLESDGFDDLATRAELLDRIQAADAGLVARVDDLRAQVAAELATVEQAEAEAIAFNERIATARDRIASVRQSAEAEAAALAAMRERQRSTLSRLQSQVETWTAEVQRQQRVSAEQARETVAGWVGDWAIPRSIVMCESGGSFEALNPSSGAGGAYQILPSTWRLYGGKGKPHQASPAEQHRIAAQIWKDSGSTAWVC